MVREKAKKGKDLKPKYNMVQNFWFMIKLAWTSGEKKVLVLSLLSAALAVALNLVNLYVSPAILSAVACACDRVDIDNHWIYPRTYACISGIFICKYKHSVRQSLRPLCDHQSAERKSGYYFLSEYG